LVLLKIFAAKFQIPFNIKSKILQEYFTPHIRIVNTWGQAARSEQRKYTRFHTLAQNLSERQKFFYSLQEFFHVR